MAKGKEILRGFSKVPGIVTVTVRVVDDNPAKFAAVKPGEAIVAERTTPEEEANLKKAAAIIADTGGVTSHSQIFGVANNIPTISGTEKFGYVATGVLHDGQKIVVDGNIGKDEKGRQLGAVYEWVPGAAGAAPSPMDVANKYGIKLNASVMDKLAQLKGK